jgi:diguanylate cyclase (GGDEF)-like protein
MNQAHLSLEVPEKALKNRVAQEFFLVARESAVGAFLTILVVIVTHWGSQPSGQLAVWVAGASLALALRAVSAQIFLAMDTHAKERWYGVLYGAQWIGFVVTAAMWVLSLSMLGSGAQDPLFYVRTIFVIAVLSFYLSVIGIDRWLYGCFAATMAFGFWLDLMVYYPQFLVDLPSTPIALALYCALLLVRSRSEQNRLHDSIRAQMRQEILLKELGLQATRDALTGTNNRGQIESELRRLIKLEERRDGRLSVLLLDVDHFKQINDRHGHDVGDVVLRQLAKAATETLRDSDILGRWGGEEFLAVLPDTPAAAALEVAQRLREAIAALEPVDASGQRVKVSASVGVAQHQPGDSSDVVTKHADLALYQAKESGRNCCVLFATK